MPNVPSARRVVYLFLPFPTRNVQNVGKEYKDTVLIQTEKSRLVKLPHRVTSRVVEKPAKRKPKEHVVDIVEPTVPDNHETNKVAWMAAIAGLGWWIVR